MTQPGALTTADGYMRRQPFKLIDEMGLAVI
jgi:hypothetical protein